VCNLYISFDFSRTLSYKISLVVVFRQEDGLANSFDDIQVRLNADTFSEIRKTALTFITDYNNEPTNRARIYDWYVAESKDLIGLGHLDLEEEGDD
jgi:hypothetical protein